MASTAALPAVLDLLPLEGVEPLSRATGEDDTALARRLAAVRILAETPLPQRAQHLWRYTDPAQFLPASDPTATLPTPVTPEWKVDDRVAASALLAGSTLRSVELSEEARNSGVVVTDLHTAEGAPLGGIVPAEHGFLEALNAATWRGGVLVKVPAGVTLAEPIRLRVIAGADGSTAMPRILVLAGQDSNFEVVEGQVGGEGPARVIAVTEVEVGPRAQVRYGIVQRWGRDVVGHATAYARLGEGSRFQMALASFGGATAKADVGAILAGAGASSEIYGVALASAQQRFDLHTEHIHAHPQTFSNLDVKVALTDAARSAYTGIIRIAEHAKGCEAYQENRNLLLSPDARAESIPELEILNEDVRCSHGATVAPLEPEQLFYLSSRGLAPNHAMRLIVYGFLDQTLRRLPESTRQRIQALVAERLHAE